ncbi:hypothetical protein QVD17_14296 [Tagetes erecta]|uniref:Uncharacterized protein n=1 Tax=Tagetes erecta TaxID=13708 RepID=A0AAD8KYU3_TARER|nr:hypothetical protein QVD17_14296 [Tagetes erecta]
MGRSLGCLRRMFKRTSHNELKGSVSDKQAKIQTGFTLEGFEASELKTLLPVVQQQINSSLVELRKVVRQHLDANGVKYVDEGVLVGTHNELETLLPVVLQQINSSFVELRKVVRQHLDANGVKYLDEGVLAGTHNEVLLEGLNDSEARTLRRVPGYYEMPKDTGNEKHHWSDFFKKMF